MAINNNSGATSGSTSLSMENQLMDFYLSSLKDFSNIWLTPADQDQALQKIQLQFIFLVQTIPDTKTRNKIWAEQKRIESLLKNEQATNAYEKSCMVAVSAVMEFLASTFDLMHEDILGPATSKQFREAVLEIPEMPPTVAPIEPPTSNTEA